MPKKEDIKNTAKEAEAKTTSSTKAAKEAAAKATEAVKEAAKTATKVVEEKAKEAEKTVAKKTTAAKKTVKKAATKAASKAAAKVVDVGTKVVVQYQNNENTVEAIEERVKAQFISEGHRASSIKKLDIYIKPEEYSAYYVINEKFSGRVDLF